MGDSSITPSIARLLIAGVAALAGCLLLPATGHAIALSCMTAAPQPAASTQLPLRFGIYPGGPAGSVDPKAAPRPEDPAQRLASLQSLAGSNPFVVRLYSAWTANAAADDVSGWLDREIADYTAAGMQVELVVRYKPATGDATSSPAAFAAHIRRIVSRYGPNAGFVVLQVTNEANIPGAPEAADGAFAGAKEALVEGVIAAKDQVRRGGHGQVRIGFSWAYDERPVASTEFWAALGRLGGSAFTDAVDWVGLDSYPGTWAPQIALSSLLPGLAAIAVKDSVRALRNCYLPMAGLGASTSLHIAENGFPTGPGRSEALQSQVLEAMVGGLDAIREAYGVTDYRWFDLRDSSSSDPSIESQYGITRDDYAPKPAFATYRSIIAGHGRVAAGATVPVRAAPLSTAAGCGRSPVKVVVPRWKGRRVTSLVVRVGNKVVKRSSRPRVPRVVKVSLRPGRRIVRLRLTASSRGKRVFRAHRRTYRIC